MDKLPKPLKYLWWALTDFVEDNGPQWAAALAYYALLSVFPLLLAALSIATFFVDPDFAADQATSVLGSFLPTGQEQIRSIVESVFEARGGVSLIALALLLWTGSRVFGVATQALNIAFDADESYGFVKRTALQFAMAATLGLLLIAALASRWAIGFAWGRLGLEDELGWLLTALQWLIPGALLVVTLFLAYRWVPRTRVNNSAALVGAAVSTVAFLIARPLFSYYVTRVGNYNMIYGSLAVVIILVLWAWLSAMILLFGGEIAALLEAMEHRGKTRREVEEHHRLRSPVRKLKETVRESAS